MGFLVERLVRESTRWPLWFPVYMAAGVAGYFALPAEPPLWLGVAALGAFGFGAYGLRRHHGWLSALLALAILSLGFSAAQWRTAQVAAPVLHKPLATSVQGKVSRLERFEDRLRITLERPRIRRLDAHETPARVRISLRGAQPAMRPGDWIAVRARLSPPPEPSAPGAFDFQRRAYFEGWGAVGFGFGRADVLASAEADAGIAINTALERLRQKITRRVRAFDNTPAGAIAAALMTGDRSAIPEALMEKVRDSGLAHLLAISGLHIGLVAGFIFFGLRWLLALVPPVALRFPIKKWAAAVAIPGALVYALISGATVPTLRAFLMVTLVLLAVLLDRRGISMRMVAWAAAVILLFQPESLLGPSFQMSFAAVVALIAVYEAVSRYDQDRAFERRSVFGTVGVYVGGVALTTLVAGLATAPFAIYHFNRFALYGLAANMIAVPATALWIMPWAVIAFVLMPFGLEALALEPMIWGVRVVIFAAETVAAWPGAAWVLPAMSNGALILIALGLLWMCLWQYRWRYFGAAGIAAGLASLAFYTPPDILIDGEGKLTAVRLQDGRYAVTSMRRKSYTRDVWLRRIGTRAAPLAWPGKDQWDRYARLRCDGLGCIYRAARYRVALANHPAALLEDCPRVDLVIGIFPIRQVCSGPVRTVDRFDLWRAGAHSIRLEKDEIVVDTVNARRGARPWVHRYKEKFGRRGGDTF